MTVKAKIVPKKEIVLLYRHKQAKNAQALLPLLERLQFDYRLVEDGELGLTVGQLAGYSPGYFPLGLHRSKMDLPHPPGTLQDHIPHSCSDIDAGR